MIDKKILYLQSGILRTTLQPAYQGLLTIGAIGSRKDWGHELDHLARGCLVLQPGSKRRHSVLISHYLQRTLGFLLPLLIPAVLCKRCREE